MNNKKKGLEGVVVSNLHALNATLLVKVTTRKYNGFYNKIVTSSKMYTAHHASREPIEVGAKVTLYSCAPISKTKSHTAVFEGGK